MAQWLVRAMAFGIVILGAWGCNSKPSDGSVKGLTTDDAAKLNSSRASAWGDEDPPITADTHIAAGQLAETQGDLPGAIAQYKTARELDPKNSFAVYRMGIVYSQMRDYPQAINSWTTYSRMTGDSAESYCNLGFCYELSGDSLTAQNTYELGLVKHPKNQALQVNYGLLLARAGKVDEARKHFATVLSPAQVHYNVGSVYEIQGRKELARQEYIQAIQADPNFLDARSRLATLDHN